MTEVGTDALRVGMLCEVYPTIGETFIRRQVAHLQAHVACAVDRCEELGITDEAASVRSLSGNQPFDVRPGWHTGRRILARLFGEPVPTWSRAAEQAFDQWLREIAPDVLLGQFGQNAVRALPVLEQHNVPLVTQFFGQDASALLRRARYRSRLPALFQRSAAVVVMGLDMGERLTDAGCPKDKIHVIPVGVPMDQIPRAAQVDRQPCRFVAAHRWVEKKGVLQTLEAFRRCREEVAQVRFDLVGGGPLEGEIQRFLTTHELQDAVQLHASMPNHELHARLISQAGCLVQHSKTAPNGDREGWPVVIAEAAAAGLPVVATHHAAIPEQVLDGQTGFLVEEDDVAGMAAAMTQLAKDPAARRQMGQAAHEHTRATGALATQLARLREVLATASRRASR